MINKTVYKALRIFLDDTNSKKGEYLFASQKNKRPLKIQSINALIKKWTGKIKLAGNYGAHTLRKTFRYIQRTEFGVGFEVLAKRFNPTSPAVTIFVIYQK